MVKSKVSLKGLDREFCHPVTCAKLNNIDAWLMNPNVMQSFNMSNLSYITFVIPLCDHCSIW